VFEAWFGVRSLESMQYFKTAPFAIMQFLCNCSTLCNDFALWGLLALQLLFLQLDYPLQ
jgi:hypothetical protein